MSAPTLRRGVHHAPYSIDGNDVLLAIDSSGNRLAEYVLAESSWLGDSESLASSWLDGCLEHHDPT